MAGTWRQEPWRKAIWWLTLGYAQTSFLRQTRVISRWLALLKVDWAPPLTSINKDHSLQTLPWPI